MNSPRVKLTQGPLPKGQPSGGMRQPPAKTGGLSQGPMPGRSMAGGSRSPNLKSEEKLTPGPGIGKGGGSGNYNEAHMKEAQGRFKAKHKAMGTAEHKYM